jgi:hypothetical protein
VTQTSDELPGSWIELDKSLGHEYRQISLDTFEIRSKTHVIMVNQEGMDLYRKSWDSFAEWLVKNDIKNKQREDLDVKTPSKLE